MRIVVGLSGGVDSSVAAYLLQQQGHEVIGLFMRNWHDETVVIDNECPWIDDANDAVMVADYLGIPFQVLDLSEAYRERIVDYMFSEYGDGRTPNPDILCNREIKFDLFLKSAIEIGAEAVASLDNMCIPVGQVGNVKKVIICGWKLPASTHWNKTTKVTTILRVILGSPTHEAVHISFVHHEFC